MDEKGFLGRECPSEKCRRYFKIKPGTGLKGENLPVHCPYCGHVGKMGDFHTQAQVNYAISVVGRQVMHAAMRDLKDMAREFDRQTSRGLFSIKMDVRASPSPLRYYAEQELETDVECQNCTLQYSVYGVFAFCPDCGKHNSLQILEKNLELVEKMLGLAASMEKDMAEKLVENALEDCVSAFDGFGRELCRVHAKKASNPTKAGKISFQNLDGARTNVLAEFGMDLAVSVPSEEWASAVLGFQKRHLLAHKMGVVDRDYVEKTGDRNAVVGRKVVVDPADVRAVLQVVRRVGRYLSEGMQGQSNRLEEKG